MKKRRVFGRSRTFPNWSFSSEPGCLARQTLTSDSFRVDTVTTPWLTSFRSLTPVYWPSRGEARPVQTKGFLRSHELAKSNFHCLTMPKEK